MNEVIERSAFSPVGADGLTRVMTLQSEMLKHQNVPITTEHVLHGGMYARKIVIPAGTLLVGALIKVKTVLVIDGRVTVSNGDDVIELDGNTIVQGGVGRKQVFLAHTDTTVTMVFPTLATTIYDAECEFTDEHENLMTRRG